MGSQGLWHINRFRGLEEGFAAVRKRCKEMSTFFTDIDRN